MLANIWAPVTLANGWGSCYESKDIKVPVMYANIWGSCYISKYMTDTGVPDM